MNRRILFRIDANTTLGTGHAMRSLAIAKEWKKRGGQCGYLMKECPPELYERIAGEKVDVIKLAKGDIRETKIKCDEYGTALICVDGFHFGSEYLEQLHALPYPLVVIDDLVMKQPISADAVINPQLEAVASDYPGIDKEHLFLGIEYLPLRDEFISTANDFSCDINKRNHILITFGGTDPAFLTFPFIKAIVPGLANDVILDVVIGMNHPDLPAVRDYVASTAIRINIHRNVRDMAALMRKAGMAVTAAGSTLWELAAQKVPSVPVIVSENQKVIVRYPYWVQPLDAINRDSETVAEEVAAKALSLWQEPARRMYFSARMNELKLDGGNENICKIFDSLINDAEGRRSCQSSQ